MPPRDETLHDLRNQLSKILMQVEVLRVKAPDDVHPNLDKLTQYVDRAKANVGALEEDPEARDRTTVRVPAGCANAADTYVDTQPGSATNTTQSGPFRGRETRVDGPGAAPPSADVMAGTVIGEMYRVLRELGRGGMGTVFLARDARLGRLVAVKLVHHASWRGSDAHRAFVVEAQAMARVRHPNVVAIYAFGEHENKPYFAMEYVPGTTLDRLLAMRERPLPVDRATSIIDQACRGLEAIHRAGAIHCDVKPGNILLGRGSRVAVADLGLARTVAEGKGMTGGTPGFIAPELLRDPLARATERADVYAIGALTYLVLAGRAPFHGEGADAIFFQQLEGNFERLSEVADVPAVFAPIVERALSLEPGERHPSVEAFRRELLAAHESLQRTYLGTRVFVVDDDADQVVHTSSLVREALPQATVLGFSDARSALRESENAMPDIAVVDLEMPEINGVELTAAFKAHGASQSIHVVMLTGVGSARDWEVLQHLGVSGFLTKPVDEAELASLMRHLAVADL